MYGFVSVCVRIQLVDDTQFGHDLGHAVSILVSLSGIYCINDTSPLVTVSLSGRFPEFIGYRVICVILRVCGLEPCMHSLTSLPSVML